MRKRFASCWILAGAAFFSAALSPREVHARACSVASDCPRGFECLGATSGGGTAGSCASLSCQSDADCGTGTRCYLDVGTRCVTAPDGGQSCGPASACTPQWQVPCTVDSDCGPGFTCSGSTGYYQCGPNQANVMLAPYQTSMTVPCSAVPKPPFLPPADSGFAVPEICDAGSSCLYVSSKTCVAQQTPSCKVDSDCPSTWTCQCPMTCGFSGGPAMLADAGGRTVDAACTKACVAPNSDLGVGVCNGSFGGPASGGGGTINTPSPTEGGTDSGATGSASPGPGSSNGGCQIGATDTTTGWTLGAVAAFAWASRRGRRARR
jgi:hypothetical protein